MGKYYIKPAVLRGMMFSASVIGGNTGLHGGDLEEEEEDVFTRMLFAESQENIVSSVEPAAEVSIPLDGISVMDSGTVPEVSDVLTELTGEAIDLS